jgi:hypothetical protein
MPVVIPAAADLSTQTESTEPKPAGAAVVVREDQPTGATRRGLGIIGSVYAGLREEIVKFGTSRSRSTCLITSTYAHPTVTKPVPIIEYVDVIKHVEREREVPELTFSSIAAKSTSPVKATVPEPAFNVLDNIHVLDDRWHRFRNGCFDGASGFGGDRRTSTLSSTSSASARCPS